MKSYNQEEFNRMVSDNDLEVFTADQLQSFAKQADAEIKKSEGSKEEIMKAVADEIRTFTPNKVWGLNNYGQLDSKIMFTRSQQVEWEPVEGDEIQKSRGGVYKDTPENRKLGRVGKKFGGVKSEEPDSADEAMRRHNERWIENRSKTSTGDETKKEPKSEEKKEDESSKITETIKKFGKSGKMPSSEELDSIMESQKVYKDKEKLREAIETSIKAYKENPE